MAVLVLAIGSPPNTITLDSPTDYVHRRPLAPGESQRYRIKGEPGIMFEVWAGTDPAKGKLSAPLETLTVTQVCGVSVYVWGGLIAKLRNRARVRYFGDLTWSPAEWLWYDMRGTRSEVTWARWTSLSQWSVPGVYERFSRGYVQAWGLLERCLFSVCTSDYYSSRLHVDRSGTYCR